ncbi:MAG: T9SS type A sorting domain-containing protein [Bacteroidota bacterium]|nr:T9SS type A sorting domain-containing protein [Bacteroidota bacterium]
MKTKITIFIIGLSFLFGYGFSQTVSLFAGTTQTIGHNATGKTLLNAYFAYPYGMAYDSEGRLWVTNFGGPEDMTIPGSPQTGHTVSVILPNGMVYTRAGSYAHACLKNGIGINCKFFNPAGIAVGPDDTIYIADYENHVIRKMVPFQSLANPQTVSVLAGKFYQPQPNSQCYTTYPGFANGSAKVAQFNHPIDVDVDANGNVYVADRDNHCIRKITPSGMVSTFAGMPGQSGDNDDDNKLSAKFNYPSGVHYDDATGDLYVTEFGNSQLRKISASGKVTTIISNLATIAPYQPEDVVMDNQSNIYLTSYHRILKYANNKTSIFAGDVHFNGYTGYVNDTGTSARFDNVKEMVVDPDDLHYIYVADQYNHVIRKIVICTPFKPTITHSGNLTTCTGDTVTLSGPSGFIDYKWSNGKTTKDITIKGKGTYNLTLTVQNDDHCYGVSDQIKVTIYDYYPTVTPSGPTTFCTGGSVDLVGPNGLDYYYWTKDGNLFMEGANKQTITVNQTGAYILQGTKGICKGNSTAKNILVTDHVTPILKIIKGDSNLCQGEELILRTTANNYATYDWKKGSTSISTQSSITITEAGTYSVYVTTGTGCDGTSYGMLVTVNPKPSKPTITIGTDSVLNSSASSGNQWYWYGSLIQGATSQSYMPSKDGYYKVVVTNQYGCSNESDTIAYGDVSINEFDVSSSFDVFPNPGTGLFTLKSGLLFNEKLIININDLTGRIVFNKIVDVNKRGFTEEFDLRNLEKGIYFISIKSENKLANLKIIIE